MQDGYVGLVAWTDKAATALASSSSETSLLLGTAGKWTMPGGFVEKQGKYARLKAAGRISTVVTTPGTFTFKVKAGSTAIATSQAMPLNVIAKTNVTWWLDLLLTTRAIGDTTLTTVMANGLWTTEAILASPAASAGGISAEPWQTSAPVVGTGFDTTIANLIDLTGTWSVSSASNSIQVEQYALEWLN
jgi:hypothetical protein